MSFEFDPDTNTVEATIPIPTDASACSGFAFSDDAVWMPSCFDAVTIARIDPVTNTVVATIPLNGFGDNPIIIDGKPWLGVEGIGGAPGRIVRIDPATNAIDRELSLGDAFMGTNLILAAGSVWATDWANNQVLRLPLAAFN